LKSSDGSVSISHSFTGDSSNKYFRNALTNASASLVTAGQTVSFSVTFRDNFGRGYVYDPGNSDAVHTYVAPHSDCQNPKHVTSSFFAVSDTVVYSFLLSQACLHLSKTVQLRQNFLLATYYSSTSLAAPVATRLAASIDFSGSSLSSQPVSSLVSGVGWSVRWSGFVRAPVAGGATWTFFIGLAQGGNGGDGVRGWVDGVAVVDGWGGIAGSEVSGTVVLSGASNSYYEVVVEYKAVGAAYGCTLSWQSSTYSAQVIPSNRLFGCSFFAGTPITGVVHAVLDASFSTLSSHPSAFDVLGSSLITLSGKGFSSLINKWHCLFVSEDSQFQALSSLASVDSDNSVVCVSPPWFFEATMSYVILMNDGLFLDSPSESVLDFPRYGNGL
jgi:hypothetical protein